MTIARHQTDYINCDELQWYLTACGFPADSAACYGFAGASIPFLLLGRAEEVNQRLFLMKQILKEYDITLDQQRNLAELIKHVMGHGLSHCQLSRMDRLLIEEIPAFCEAIYFHYHPERFPSLFSSVKLPKSQNLKRTLPFFLPDGVHSIAASPVFTGAYQFEQGQLHAYFVSLSEVIHSHSSLANIMPHVVVLLSNIGHTSAVSYDVQMKRWRFLDVKHQFIEECNNINELVNKVNQYLTGNNTVVCSSQLFGVDKSMIKTIYFAWQKHPVWCDLHRVSHEKLSLVDWYHADLAHVAAQNADMNTLKRIVDLSENSVINYFNSRNWFKLTPLQLAIQEGHDIVVEFLLSKGVDPTIGEIESPLLTAYKYERHDIARLLRQFGAQLKKDEVCPANSSNSLFLNHGLFGAVGNNEVLCVDDSQDRFNLATPK